MVSGVNDTQEEVVLQGGESRESGDYVSSVQVRRVVIIEWYSAVVVAIRLKLKLNNSPLEIQP